MEPQSWSVPVGGLEHDVRLETDPITGKTFVRVDGRIATRPILAEEEEREFPIGGAAYLLRRLPAGNFGLDVAPPSPGNPNWGGPKTQLTQRIERDAVQAPKRENRGKIIGIAVAIVAVLCSRYAWSQFSYMHVKWEPYNGPSGRFSIMFPGPPKEDQQQIADGRGTAVVLSSGYRDHGYGLTYFDLPRALPPQAIEPILKKIVDAIVEKQGGALVEPATPQTYLDHPAIAFYARVAPTAEHGTGYMRGKIVVCQGKRIYTAFGIVPRYQLVTWDVTEFLNSFELAKDEGFRPAESAPEPLPAPTEVPTYPGDPRVPPEPPRKPLPKLQ
jgi:hypothetical protein